VSAVLVLAAAAGLGWKLFSRIQPYAPAKARALAYVGDRSCAECHAKIAGAAG
jgi:hypothetical protein